MIKIAWSLALILAFSCTPIKEKESYSVAFYNVENLFDTINNPRTYDDDYTPNGNRQWNTERYKTKVLNLSNVLSGIVDGYPADFVGLCEVENKEVVMDLIHQPGLENTLYDVVHYDSKDERGMDVAFIYNSLVFTATESKSLPIDMSEWRDYTRDILYVKGNLANGEELHFFVNHWPSRREGRKKSEPKRMQAAKELNKYKQEILNLDPNAKIIVMGDFNDEPSNRSISDGLNSTSVVYEVGDGLYNTMADLEEQDLGSYKYGRWWDMLDQIMLSNALMTTDTGQVSYQLNSASIYSEEWIVQHGKYEGSPLRTFGGKNYLGGFSDHFPVYIKLIIN